MQEARREHDHRIEPKPGFRSGAQSSLQSAAEEIPLSPRVVDRLAFDEYVRLLRSEIDRATTESELLARRAEAGAVVLEQLERFLGENAGEIERAAEILTGIDDRANSTRELLDSMDQKAASIERIATDAERAVEARAEAFQSRLRSIVDTAMDRFEETEDQLSARAASMRRELIDRLEQMRGRGEETLSRLDDRAAAIGSEVEESVARADARLDALRSPIRELLAELEGRSQRLDARAAEHLASIETGARTAHRAAANAAAELTKRQTAIQAKLDQHQSQMLDAASKLDLQRDSATRQLAEETGRATETLRAELEPVLEVERRLEAAMQRVVEPRMIETIERAEKSGTQAHDASTELRSLLEQAGMVRDEVGAAILDGASQVDALRDEAESLTQAGREQTDRLEQVLSESQSPLAVARQWLDAMTDVASDRPPAVIQKLIETVRETTRDEVRSEMSIELEMATASLAALSERVQKLEAKPKRQATATTQRKAVSKKAPSKKAASKKAASRGAAADQTSPKIGEPKPAAPTTKTPTAKRQTKTTAGPKTSADSAAVEAKPAETDAPKPNAA